MISAAAASYLGLKSDHLRVVDSSLYGIYISVSGIIAEGRRPTVRDYYQVSEGHEGMSTGP